MVELLIGLIWIFGLVIGCRALVYALAVPFVHWVRSEQDLTPKSGKKKISYNLRYFDLVIVPIALIGLGVKYIWDLGRG